MMGPSEIGLVDRACQTTIAARRCFACLVVCLGLVGCSDDADEADSTTSTATAAGSSGGTGGDSATTATGNRAAASGSGGTGTTGNSNGGSTGSTSDGVNAATSGNSGAGGWDNTNPTNANSSTTGPAMPSPGCGTGPTLTPAEWVEQVAVTVRGVDRRWWIWLPNDYDPERAYPVVVLLHGCGNENNNVPIERESGSDAILVKGKATSDCWENGTDGPDAEFFDAMLDTTFEQLCVDADRVFAAGYSSGAWLTNALNCQRGDRLRAVATVSGGDPFSFGNAECSGNVAALFIHDQNDETIPIERGEAARDRLLEANGCTDTTMPIEPEPCVEYQGCQPELPVVWCATSGHNHDRQDGLAPAAMWSFFSRF